jgi:hypothetical protein
MALIPVSSSNLAAVGYNGRTLIIAFRSGGLYAYFGVSFSEYTGLMQASSHGKYFHQNIKGRYSYRRLQ